MSPETGVSTGRDWPINCCLVERIIILATSSDPLESTVLYYFHVAGCDSQGIACRGSRSMIHVMSLKGEVIDVHFRKNWGLCFAVFYTLHVFTLM